MSSEMRKQQFKKGIDSEKGRRGRQDVTINIRKQKKEEGLAKRRQTSSSPSKDVTNAQTMGATLVNLPVLVAGVNSADKAMNLEAVRAVRAIRSRRNCREHIANTANISWRALLPCPDPALPCPWKP
jgi:hypothetical protein